ncbi:hypothetical protein [Pyrobaculum aerophilum]|nr:MULTISPECIES: hypothetical protein [Pyrobaculum]
MRRGIAAVLRRSAKWSFYGGYDEYRRLLHERVDDDIKQGKRRPV